jgi:hypothetical protein
MHPKLAGRWPARQTTRKNTLFSAHRERCSRESRIAKPQSQLSKIDTLFPAFVGSQKAQAYFGFVLRLPSKMLELSGD